MAEGTTPTAPHTPARRPPSPAENTVWAMVTIGVLLVIVGLADGLMMAFKRKVTPCPDGHYFPGDATDFNCYVHPQAGVGIAIVVLSALLGLVVALSGIAAAAILRAGSSTAAVDLVDDGGAAEAPSSGGD